MARMKPVSVHDYYQTKRCYGDSSMDLASLTDFYLPLIGSRPFAAYMALTREDGNTHAHEGLMVCLDLTPGEFETALSALEAVGLVRTFVKPIEGAQLFVYCIYAPLHAAEFSSDIMLSGTLKGKIGIEEFERICSRHQGEQAMEDMEEVSVSFPDYFRPSYNPEFYLGKPSAGLKAGKAAPKTGFDRAFFVASMEKLGLCKNGLSEEEIVAVEKLATLYSLPEATIAELAYGCLRINAPVGKKLDLSALGNAAAAAMPFGYIRQEQGRSSGVKPKSDLAEKIIMMDEMPPARYLSVLQNNHKPASADLRIIEKLKMEIGLADPCINALIEWVLHKNDNVLSAAYCEKLGAAMVRAGCRSARDAMDYLTRSSRRKKKVETPVVSAPVETPVEEQSKPTPSSDSNGSDLDAAVDQALKDLFGD